MNINFSFIIPHKNTPDLLQKCLDSIPRRDDVQIIVVDDNSDTDKVDFSNFPGLNDPTVEVYLTKEGRGAGYARNVGLEHAIGKWIVFADADDYFEDSINTALNRFANLETEIIFVKGKSLKIPSNEPSIRGVEYNRRVDIAINTNDFTEVLLYSSPCRKFFSCRFLKFNNIIFNEVHPGDDIVFMARVAFFAKSFLAFDISLYTIIEHDLSQTKHNDINTFITIFIEESNSLKLYRRTKYRNEQSLYFWHFQTWLDIWKLNHFKSLSLLPIAIKSAGVNFFFQALKAKLQK